MKWKLTNGFVVAFLIVGMAPARAEPSYDYYGDYEGTGRACAGKLRIETKRLIWQTPFSRCGPSKYRVLGQPSEAKGSEIEFQLLNPGRMCRYPFLVLSHPAEAQSDRDWSIIGFPTISALKDRDMTDALDCYLAK